MRSILQQGEVAFMFRCSITALLILDVTFRRCSSRRHINLFGEHETTQTFSLRLRQVEKKISFDWTSRSLDPCFAKVLTWSFFPNFIYFVGLWRHTPASLSFEASLSWWCTWHLVELGMLRLGSQLLPGCFPETFMVNVPSTQKALASTWDAVGCYNNYVVAYCRRTIYSWLEYAGFLIPW